MRTASPSRGRSVVAPLVVERDLALLIDDVREIGLALVEGRSLPDRNLRIEGVLLLGALLLLHVGLREEIVVRIVAHGHELPFVDVDLQDHHADDHREGA